jgi:putative oxidoreductase
MVDTRTAPYAALLLRVALGVTFLAHGFYLKIFVFTVAGTVQFFESLGYPALFAYAVIGGETMAGLLLIAGVYARWVALGTLPILLGALLVHLPNGWLFSAPGGGWEFPLFLIVAAGVQGLLGNGALAPKLPPLGTLLGLGRKTALA